MEFRDYYATLGVPKTASDAEIKKAYRKLARKHHPDLNPGDKAAEARFKEVNEANEVIGDSDKRRKYDELGANWRQYEHDAQAPRGGHGPAPGGGSYRTMTPEEMEEAFGGGAPFSDFFQAFFGGGEARPGRRPRRGRDLEQAVTLTLEEAFAGTTRHVVIKLQGHAREVDVRIPAGVRDGARVRSTGEGESAPAGGTAGDLYLDVHIQPHERFERRDTDLYVRVGVPITTAVLGGEVAVPALSGSTLRLKIPEMTAAGRVFRMRGHGMPVIGKADARGDLYATIEITLPAKLSAEAREHYEALRKLE